MKRPKLTREENNTRIGAEGARAARGKFAESRKTIRKEMKNIEADVEKNGGIYPFAGGKVTVAEVLRRAGKSAAYLRKEDPPELKDLRDEVEAWVDRVTKEIGSGSRLVRKKITDRVREAQAELKLVRQAYAEAELEYSDALAMVEIAEKTIEELRAENLELRSALSEKTIVKFSPKHNKIKRLDPSQGRRD